MNYRLQISPSLKETQKQILSMMFDSGWKQSDSNSDRQWVDDVTSIVGTESVDINVDGKLKMEGSLIANIDKEGVDQGNLNIKAGSLETSDLYDMERSEEKGYNVAVSVSKSGTKTQNDGFPTGSTTVGIKDTGYEKEGITHATIGQGNIEVADGSDVSNINRDINNVQEITKDQITGALDATVTVDNRILSLVAFNTDGVKDIAKDFENLTDNIKQIGKGLAHNIVTESISNAISDENTGLVQAVKDYIRDDNKISDIQKNDRLTAELNGETNLTPEQVQKSLQAVADIAGANGEFMGDLSISNIENGVAGFAYTDEKGTRHEININLAKVDLANPSQLVNVIFHETTNQERHSQNHKTAENRGDTAEAIWELKNYGNQNTNQMTGGEWLTKNENSNILNSGTDNYLTSKLDGILNKNTILNNYDGRTGKVEQGDTLESITKEINNFYGTNLSSKDLKKINDISNENNISVGDVILAGTLDSKDGTWKVPQDLNQINIEYWNSLNDLQKMMTNVQRKNFYDDTPEKEGLTLEEMKKDPRFDVLGEAIAHNLAGTSNNIDIRGKNELEKQQYIYNTVTGEFDRTPQNTGTVDYSPPNIFNYSSLEQHNIMDVEPWLVFGNGPDDMTTMEERLAALKSSSAGLVGFKLFIEGKGGLYDKAISNKQ